MPSEVDSYFDLLDKTTKDTSNKIYRLYRHHCIYGIKNHKHTNKKKKFKHRNNEKESDFVLIKDLSRIPLPQNKYIIIDLETESYFDHEKDHLISMGWSGNPYDNGLKILADSLYPILR